MECFFCLCVEDNSLSRWLIPESKGATHNGVCGIVWEHVLSQDAEDMDAIVLGLVVTINISSDSSTSKLWFN